MPRKVIYRITYPNGKIYVGMDVTDTLTYFGSVDSQVVAQDFTPEQRDDFTVRKEILWSSETATDTETREEEIELIRANRSNVPGVGYNQRPAPRIPSRC